jgi:hypothetical protein
MKYLMKTQVSPDLINSLKQTISTPLEVVCEKENQTDLTNLKRVTQLNPHKSLLVIWSNYAANFSFEKSDFAH